jgi:hypothetical protein
LAKGGAAPLPGVHRRDVLLALFWPDADDERARVALKAAIHFLRRALGDGVIVNRGASEIAVAPHAIACDANSFESAIAAGKMDVAAELYRGDFLPGFHISGAPTSKSGWSVSGRVLPPATAKRWSSSRTMPSTPVIQPEQWVGGAGSWMREQ